MQTIVYDTRFNLNEIATLCAITAGYASFLLVRKIHPPLETILYLLLGIFTGLLFDHAISVYPIDFYDVNDTSSLELFDVLTYVSYGPFSYFFLYGYKRFHIKSPVTAPYVLGWAVIAILAEFAGVKAGIFHYKNGYQIWFSFPIYLSTLSAYILLYRYIQSRKNARS